MRQRKGSAMKTKSDWFTEIVRSDQFSESEKRAIAVLYRRFQRNKAGQGNFYLHAWPIRPNLALATQKESDHDDSNEAMADR